MRKKKISKSDLRLIREADKKWFKAFNDCWKYYKKLDEIHRELLND